MGKIWLQSENRGIQEEWKMNPTSVGFYIKVLLKQSQYISITTLYCSICL